MTRPSVLFVCTHNSARSQLAEALLRRYHGDRYRAASAGTVATRVKPEAAAVLGELGIDVTPLHSKTADSLRRTFDYVVTVCDDAREACPFVPAALGRVHRAFVDPSLVTTGAEARIQAFRAARDEIRAWIDATFHSVPPAF